MIRVPNHGPHDLASAPQALPIATVRQTYSKNVAPDVLSGKKVHLSTFASLTGDRAPSSGSRITRLHRKLVEV
jgi:hypothetical protein